MSATPRLLALSDLHVAFPENSKIVEGLRPESGEDWLLEVSLGYPREWQHRAGHPGVPRQILPALSAKGSQ